MKRLFTIILFTLLSSIALQGQIRTITNLPKYDQKKYHFGFILGLNQMDFVIKTNPSITRRDSVYGVVTDGEMGFNIGIVSNLRIAEYLDLRFIPTLSFGDRNIIYSVKKFSEFIGDTIFTETEKKVESTYIDFPFYLKYKSKRLGNTRAYVIGGFRYGIDLASQAKKKEKEDEYLIKLVKDDLQFELGVGFDFYLTYFKFGIEAKMGYGISDLLKRENNIYTNSIDWLSSKVFQLSFTFE